MRAARFSLTRLAVRMPSMSTATQSSPGADDRRIGVTILTGFLGSGKTTLLNRLVQDAAYADAAVIVNEVGDIGVDHHLLRHAGGHIMLIEGGCICCAVNGDLVNTLRELFMLALRRQIPRFSRVLIETTGLASPAPILFTLRHEHFVAERYVHRGTITVADTQHIRSQLLDQPEAAQQVAAADLVVCTKTDLVEPAVRDAAMRAARQVNPAVPIVIQRPDAPLDAQLTVPSSIHSPANHGDLSRWLRYAGSRRDVCHPHVSHAVLQWQAPVTRAVFLTAMARMQEAHHRHLLRLKGVVGFAGEAAPCVVHGVHRDLYPLEPLAAWPEGERHCWLVMIVRELDPVPLIDALREALRLPETALPPGQA